MTGTQSMSFSDPTLRLAYGFAKNSLENQTPQSARRRVKQRRFEFFLIAYPHESLAEAKCSISDIEEPYRDLTHPEQDLGMLQQCVQAYVLSSSTSIASLTSSCFARSSEAAKSAFAEPVSPATGAGLGLAASSTPSTPPSTSTCWFRQNPGVEHGQGVPTSSVGTSAQASGIAPVSWTSRRRMEMDRYLRGSLCGDGEGDGGHSFKRDNSRRVATMELDRALFRRCGLPPLSSPTPAADTLPTTVIRLPFVQILQRLKLLSDPAAPSRTSTLWDRSNVSIRGCLGNEHGVIVCARPANADLHRVIREISAFGDTQSGFGYRSNLLSLPLSLSASSGHLVRRWSAAWSQAAPGFMLRFKWVLSLPQRVRCPRGSCSALTKRDANEPLCSKVVPSTSTHLLSERADGIRCQTPVSIPRQCTTFQSSRMPPYANIRRSESRRTATTEQVLLQASTLTPQHLQRFAVTYPYQVFDFRPLQKAIPFLREGPPPLTAIQTSDADAAPDATVYAMAGLVVVHNVARTSLHEPRATHQFIEIVREHWASILSWLPQLVDYSIQGLTGFNSTLHLCSVGQFLVLFSQPEFLTLMNDSFTALSVELALRLWDDSFHDGKYVDISNIGNPTISWVFTTCLQRPSSSPLVTDALHRGNHAQAFFKSLNRRFMVLAERTTLRDINIDNVMEIFDSYTALIQVMVEKCGGMWGYVLQERSLIAYGKCLLDLVWVGTEMISPRKTLVAVWALTRLYDILFRMQPLGGRFIGKLVHLARGDAVTLVHTCLTKFPTDSSLTTAARPILEYMTLYLPYSPFCRAVYRSIGKLIQHGPPIAGSVHTWHNFQTSLLRSTMTATKGKLTFQPCCDNFGLRHDNTSKSNEKRQTCSACRSVFYCSALCQREDWLIHHRSECSGLQTLRQDRIGHGGWIPYGSKGNLAALLLQVYTEMAHVKVVDASAFPNLTPQDIVTTLDLRVSGDPLVSMKTKDRWAPQLPMLRPPCLHPRVATIFADRSSTVRIVEGIFPHHNESIHIIARISPNPDSHGNFRFVQGVGLIR
ncbi:hypothetical protein FA13DRAFT_1715918 [Coprinellus micaceus]|uniref:MYND-type domain-containing protein n=1 Tax=Coprinellus micaceus TaxID=71717 RepID=A0A4Y7SLT8_COPMI|nr:hypothetical protein FA13DRAFT_1715918 [Coprinellus micaceus]